MYDTAAPVEPTGRRRLDVGPVDPRDRPSAPVDEALGYGHDRTDRLDLTVSELADLVTRIETRLAPVLTGGEGRSYPMAGADPGDTTPEDTRAALTRRVAALGYRVNNATDGLRNQLSRLEGILEALEV